MKLRVLLALWIGSVALPAGAAPVTWLFAGTVEVIDDATPEALAALSSLGVAEGSSFSGRLVFESETSDSNALPYFGNYVGAIVSFEVTIGSLDASFGVGAPYNQFVINQSASYVSPVGYGPGTSSLFDSPILALDLLGAPGLLASDALLLTPPDLADLDPFELGHPANGWGSAFFLFGSEADLIGRLTALVPEPAQGILALVAIAGLARARQR